MTLREADARELSDALRPRLAALPVAVGLTRATGGYAVALRPRGIAWMEHPSLVCALADLGLRRADLDVLPLRGASTQGARGRGCSVRAGLSIGHPNGATGTLGAIVHTRRKGRARLLGAAHILADAGRATKGDLLLQPGPRDGGTMDDAAARLGRSVPLRARGNVCDVALGEPLDEARVDDPSVVDLGRPRGWWREAAPVGTAVMKRGRSTGVTRGRVTAVGLSGLDVELRGRWYRFDDVIEVRGEGYAFSEGGDSGALALDDDRRAVGVVFAGDPSLGVSFVCPIAPCLDALGVDLAL